MKKTQKKNTQRYNAGGNIKGKDEAHLRYLVEEILKVCKDGKSARFYAQVAAALPDGVIFQFLSEIRQDDTIDNRGAVFTTKVKRYLESRGSRGGSLTRQGQRREETEWPIANL
jgi:hypothetical protein